MNIKSTYPTTEPIDPEDFNLSFQTQWESSIRYYDDGYGPLWVYRDTGGIVGIVRAPFWESAYEIVEDEFLPVVSAEDLHEAYGMTEEEFKKAQEGDGSYDLVEGYSYQSNSTGTGVVSHDLNGEALDPLTPELMAHLEITMVIGGKKS